MWTESPLKASMKTISFISVLVPFYHKSPMRALHYELHPDSLVLPMFMPSLCLGEHFYCSMQLRLFLHGMCKQNAYINCDHDIK